nr:FAD:protein FMN transferase [uncultured Trichococcus sp.]
MLQKAGQQLDLGGIAKGYAADRARDHLVQNGCHSALINFGGNIATIGGKQNGDRWQIGVQNPLAKRGEFIGTVGLADQTMVTSGVSERFFIRDGKLGRPADLHPQRIEDQGTSNRALGR